MQLYTCRHQVMASQVPQSLQKRESAITVVHLQTNAICACALRVEASSTAGSIPQRTWVSKIVDLTLMSKILSICSSLVLTSGATAGLTAALSTRQSILPYVCTSQSPRSSFAALDFWCARPRMSRAGDGGFCSELSLHTCCTPVPQSSWQPCAARKGTAAECSACSKLMCYVCAYCAWLLGHPDVAS